MNIYGSYKQESPCLDLGADVL